MPWLARRSILHLQGDYALMDLLDTLFTKGANTQCGKGLGAGDGGGHGTSAVPFGRVGRHELAMYGNDIFTVGFPQPQVK